MTGHVLPVHPVRRKQNTGSEWLENIQIPYRSMGRLLVEEVVVHFDFGIGLEVIWHEHDGYLNMT